MELNRRNAIIFLAASLVIGGITDTLARQNIFGINFSIWSVLWVAVLLPMGYVKKRLSTRLFLFGSFVILNGLLVYKRAEPVVQTWSVFIALVSLVLMLGILYADNFMQLSIVGRVRECMSGVLNTINTNAKTLFRALSGKSKQAKPVRVSSGIIIAIIVGLIFIGLFSGSDAVFQHKFAFIGDALRGLNDWLGQYDVGRVVSIAFWVTLSGAALLVMIGRSSPVKEASWHYKKFLSKNDVSIILGTLCVVFGLFILIQVKYLFAGSQLPNGLNYADYARRGYGELLRATVLASAVIYFTVAGTKDAVQTRLRSILPSVLVVLNGIVVLSAWKRLSLYESAYGWTMARFVARLGLICILLGSILLLLWVNRLISARRLFGYSWYVVAIVLMIAAILNPIGIITERNITERSNREVPIDYAYLNHLSADSYPAVCKYAHLLKAKNPAEYELLRRKQDGSIVAQPADVSTFSASYFLYPNQSNHGLSRSYTLSDKFKQRYYGCLK